MSQAKVDKYKKEKKNRAKVQRRKKFTKVIAILLGACFIGAGIGYPLGLKLYDVKAKKDAANATINALYYEAWVQEYWYQNYEGMMSLSAEELEEALDDVLSTDSDATTSDATASDAQ